VGPFGGEALAVAAVPPHGWSQNARSFLRPTRTGGPTRSFSTPLTVLVRLRSAECRTTTPPRQLRFALPCCCSPSCASANTAETADVRGTRSWRPREMTGQRTREDTKRYIKVVFKVIGKRPLRRKDLQVLCKANRVSYHMKGEANQMCRVDEMESRLVDVIATVKDAVHGLLVLGHENGQICDNVLT
jgi:hypothetical protein